MVVTKRGRWKAAARETGKSKEISCVHLFISFFTIFSPSTWSAPLGQTQQTDQRGRRRSHGKYTAEGSRSPLTRSPSGQDAPPAAGDDLRTSVRSESSWVRCYGCWSTGGGHWAWKPSMAFFHCHALCLASSKDITFFGWRHLRKRLRLSAAVIHRDFWRGDSGTYGGDLKMGRACDVDAEVVRVVRPDYVRFDHQLGRIDADQLGPVGEDQLDLLFCQLLQFLHLRDHHNGLPGFKKLLPEKRASAESAADGIWATEEISIHKSKELIQRSGEASHPH